MFGVVVENLWHVHFEVWRKIIQQKQWNVQTSRFKWLTGHEVAININEIKSRNDKENSLLFDQTEQMEHRKRARGRARNIAFCACFWLGITYLSISFFPGNDSLSWATIIYLKETYTFHTALIMFAYICVYNISTIFDCEPSLLSLQFFFVLAVCYPFFSVDFFFYPTFKRFTNAFKKYYSWYLCLVFFLFLFSLFLAHFWLVWARSRDSFKRMMWERQKSCTTAVVEHVSVLLKLWIHESLNLMILLLEFGCKHIFMDEKHEAKKKENFKE